MALLVKNPLSKARDIKIQVPSLGQEDSLQEGLATLSSIPAWRLPWAEEPRGLQSIGSQSWTWLKWLSMQVGTYEKCILTFQPDLLNQNLWHWDPAICVLARLSNDSDAGETLVNHWFFNQWFPNFATIRIARRTLQIPDTHIISYKLNQNAWGWETNVSIL